MERGWRPNDVAHVLKECFPMIHTTARDGKTLDDIYFIPIEIP